MLEKFADGALEANLQQAQETVHRTKGLEAEMATELQEMEREISQFSSNGGGPSASFLSEKLEASKIQQVTRCPHVILIECCSGKSSCKNLRDAVQICIVGI